VNIRRSAHVSARVGETVRLKATASDPDGNEVSGRWWRWKEVDTYPGDVGLSDTTRLAARFQVPEDAKPGRTIQMVLEVTDNGTSPLTRYQRVIVTVAP
jgi:hypothetical protein